MVKNLIIHENSVELIDEIGFLIDKCNKEQLLGLCEFTDENGDFFYMLFGFVNEESNEEVYLILKIIIYDNKYYQFIFTVSSYNYILMNIDDLELFCFEYFV